MQIARPGRVKVVYVIEGLGTGGAERSLAETVGLLADRGVDATIVCLTARSEGVHKEVVAQGAAVTVLRSTSWLMQVLELRQNLRTIRPDVVHTMLFKADIVGRLASVALPATVISSVVNVSYEGGRLADPSVSRLKLAVVRALDVVTARFMTDHFHAITESVRDAAVRSLRIDPSRVTVILRGRSFRRLGESSPERRSAARYRLGIDPDAFVLLCVGRQEFQKGHGDLLQAFDALAGDQPHALLLLAGRRGAASVALGDKLRTLRSASRVRDLGHRDDVPDLMACADVLVLPSRYEGLGGVLIEAMALELPIVATDLPPVREVVDNGGNALLVPPGDSDAMAAAIASLAEDPVRRSRFAKRGVEIFRSRFSLERSVDETAAMYRCAVARKRQRASARSRSGSAQSSRDGR